MGRRSRSYSPRLRPSANSSKAGSPTTLVPTARPTSSMHRTRSSAPASPTARTTRWSPPCRSSGFLPTGAPADETEAKAAAALDEMVASQGRLAVDVWDQFGRWMSRAYTLDVDDDSLERVRELGREHALIFLPSHRSYLDPMVLRYALA